MKIDIHIQEFLKGEFDARYAPPYSGSTITVNNIINNPTPTKLTGVVMTAGNLTYFPEASLVPIVDLLGYLGYTRKDIIDLRCNALVRLVAAGMGGINNGIIYWMDRINKELNTNINYSITIFAYDDDSWDVTNIPRVHFHPLNVDPTLPKSKWVYEALMQVNSRLSYNYRTTEIDVNNLSRHSIGGLPPIVFGATDMTTRGLLSNSSDCVYLQIVQSDHKLNMHLNPHITMKTQDTYGSIFLNEFHMMTLKACITLLEIAKRHSESSISTTKEEEVELFDIQDYDSKYGTPGWLGVVPKGVKYTRHNGYTQERPQEDSDD